MLRQDGRATVHGDLLDYLALRFVDEGGSLKKLIREIVLSSAYRRSSVASTRALEVDAGNALLQHREPRRISAEAVRDSMLAVSGRIDLTPAEKPVPIHLDGFQDGRGRPGDGPVDGAASAAFISRCTGISSRRCCSPSISHSRSRPWGGAACPMFPPRP